MSSNFGRIWPVILELQTLERWKKWCLQLPSVTFDCIFVKLAGNKDRQKSSNEFQFSAGSDYSLWSYSTLSAKFFPSIYNGENDVSTFCQLLWIQSSSNLQVTRTAWNVGWVQIPARFDQSLWSYMPLSGEKMSLIFSGLMRYLSNLPVTRTGINAWNKFKFRPDRIIHFGVIRPWALNFFSHRLLLEKMMYPSFLSYSEFNLHQTNR